ncbi:MAG: hypothetical protein IPM97_03215 [Bdellovibrionaceae bacterium]|nr:hypothetical protein [Pseudobdellovibrionaceae bacterium]
MPVNLAFDGPLMPEMAAAAESSGAKINPWPPSALQAYKVNGLWHGFVRIDSVVDKTANSNTDLSQTQYDEFWRLVKNQTPLIFRVRRL